PAQPDLESRRRRTDRREGRTDGGKEKASFRAMRAPPGRSKRKGPVLLGPALMLSLYCKCLEPTLGGVVLGLAATAAQQADCAQSQHADRGGLGDGRSDDRGISADAGGKVRQQLHVFSTGRATTNTRIGLVEV